MEEKLLEILLQHDSTLCGPQVTIRRVVDLFSDSIKGIEWAGECPDCKGKCYTQSGSYRSGCIDCDGTGEITRPVTLEEVLEKVPQWIRLIDGVFPNEALCINGGVLRIKEEGEIDN